MKLRKAVSTLTTATMLASAFVMPVFATELPWNTDGGTQTVEGEGWVVEPTIEVELPGDLAFGINPLMMNLSEDSENPFTGQIVSGDYWIINTSNVPVAVSAKTKVTAADSVALQTSTITWDTSADGDDNNALQAVSGKKAVWLAQMYPKAITFDVENEVLSMEITPITAGSDDYTDIKGDTLTATDPTKSVVFVLDALDDTDGTTIVKSIGGFRFDGAVDANAAFAEGDLKVSTVFTLNVITETQKTNNYEAYETIQSAEGNFYSTVKQAKQP